MLGCKNDVCLILVIAVILYCLSVPSNQLTFRKGVTLLAQIFN